MLTYKQLLEVVCVILSVIQAVLSGGRHIVFIPLEILEKCLEIGFYSFIFGSVANCLIKISLSLSLLRLKWNDKRWFIGLWSLIVLTALVAFTSAFTIIFTCRPIRAYWNLKLVIQGNCWSAKKIIHLSYAWGGKNYSGTTIVEADGN
jgi:hypothetical protein